MAKSLYIAIPCYDGRIHVGTFMSALQAIGDLNAIGINANLESYVGDSLLCSSRNILLGKFLQTDCSDMLFLDSDISFEPGTIQRLLSHPVEFVAGLYRFKNDTEAYPCQWLPDPDNKGLWSYDPVTGEPSDDGLIEAAAVPMGFVRMSRSVAEKMYEAYAARNYEPKDVPGLTACCLFDIPFQGGQMVGEDYSFCHKWRDIGGRIWVDPHLRLDHSGSKTFKGNLAHWLRNRSQIEGLKQLAKDNNYQEMFERALGGA